MPNLTTVSRVIAGKLAENGADVYCFGEEGNQTELRDQGVKFVNDLFMKKISASASRFLVNTICLVTRFWSVLIASLGPLALDAL